MAVKIAVANQKGGCGKSTTVLCTAEALRRAGKRVLVVDTDAQCNVTDFYGAKTEDEYTVADVLGGDTPAKECVQRLPYGDIIASDKQLKDAEHIIRVDERRFTHLKRSLKSVEESYDFILIDTPPVLGVVLKNVLAAADTIVVPVVESGWALQGLIDFAEAIDLARDNNPSLRVSGILTVKAKERTKKSARMQSMAQEIAQVLNSKTFATKIRESVRTEEALTEYRVPLGSYAPECGTWQDYLRFTEELLAEI